VDGATDTLPHRACAAVTTTLGVAAAAARDQSTVASIMNAAFKSSIEAFIVIPSLADRIMPEALTRMASSQVGHSVGCVCKAIVACASCWPELDVTRHNREADP